MKWNISDLRTDSSYEFRYPRWNPCLPSLHHLSLFGKYRRQAFTISFHESQWFQFFAGALKNLLGRRFGAFWARVGWVTRTKQLFCHSLTLRLVGCEVYSKVDECTQGWVFNHAWGNREWPLHWSVSSLSSLIKLALVLQAWSLINHDGCVHTTGQGTRVTFFKTYSNQIFSIVKPMI